MGYETTLYVVQQYGTTTYRGTVDDDGYLNWEEGNNRHTVGYLSAGIVASIDLGRTGQGYFAELNARGIIEADQANVRTGFYGDDGNRLIVEDKYGDPLPTLELDDCLVALRADHERDPYRRFKAAIALLEAFTDETDWSDHARLKVVTYGH